MRVSTVLQAAAYWSSKLEVAGARTEFEQALVSVLSEILTKYPVDGVRYLLVSTDYDPDDVLLEALRAAGVECRGVLNSCEGVLPMKHSMRIYADEVVVAEGRGSVERVLAGGGAP